MEVIPPGRLPNGVTVGKMREGVIQVARNELLEEILREYGYAECITQWEFAGESSNRCDTTTRQPRTSVMNGSLWVNHRCDTTTRQPEPCRAR